MSMAERNQAIKRTLETAFGRGKVRVRGSRGTGYGWVTVDIDWTPLDSDAAQQMRGKCKELLRAAKVCLGHSYTDDTCQYESDKCHINFNPCLWYRTMRMEDGSIVGLRDYHTSEWEVVS